MATLTIIARNTKRNINYTCFMMKRRTNTEITEIFVYVSG